MTFHQIKLHIWRFNRVDPSPIIPICSGCSLEWIICILRPNHIQVASIASHSDTSPNDSQFDEIRFHRNVRWWTRTSRSDLTTCNARRGVTYDPMYWWYLKWLHNCRTNRYRRLHPSALAIWHTPTGNPIFLSSSSASCISLLLDSCQRCLPNRKHPLQATKSDPAWYGKCQSDGTDMIIYHPLNALICWQEIGLYTLLRLARRIYFRKSSWAEMLPAKKHLGRRRRRRRRRSSDRMMISLGRRPKGAVQKTKKTV